MTRRQVHVLRQTNPSFEQAYDEAIDDAADYLEAEAWRRALEGISQPVIKDGKPILDPTTGEPITLRRYSDPLLVMLLKGCKPDKYHPRGNVPMMPDTSNFMREIASDDDPPRSTQKRC